MRDKHVGPALETTPPDSKTPAGENRSVAQHLHHKPGPPSSRTELPVPPSVDAVVLACLEKKPEARPQGARELAGMLPACPVEPWTEEQSREWWTASGEA
ncbi:MAG: hypothetical protein ABI647_06975 [Gemmatimonadota bacterium]